MTIPADSLPGDHLRADELHKGKEALSRFMREHPLPPISDDTVLSHKLEECLCQTAIGAVCLEENELESIRNNLGALVQLRSVRSPQSILERFVERLSNLSRSTFPRMIAACCVLLILGNSVALAASETIPGDTLYPVKVNVIEPVVAVVTVTPEKKAAWASTCIRRRLVEAERLIVKNRLTPDTWNTLNTSITANAKVAERHIIRLSQYNAPEAAELSANLHITINAHGQVFSDIVQKNSEEDVVALAAADLSTVAAETARLYEQTEAVAWTDEYGTEKVAERVMQSASSAALRLVNTADTKNQSVPLQAKERGDKAREFLRNAQDRFKDGKFHESLRDARMAAQKAEEGNTFMRMGLHFDAHESSSANQSLMAVPVTVCGATTVEISIPAIIAPDTSATQSSKIKKKDEQRSSITKEKSSVSSSQSSVSSVKSESTSLSSSKTSTVSSIVSSVSKSSTTSVSSASSLSSITSVQPVSSVVSSVASVLSVASSSLPVVLPPIVPDIPLLH